jgi:hypothetical protein
MTPEFRLALQNEQLVEALEGATVLNVYLLNKLGGQLTVDKDEMARICNEFSRIDWGVNRGAIVIKLCSTPEKEAAYDKSSF